MTHVLPKGMEIKGKDVVSVDDLLQIKVVYVEAGFECVSFALPSGDLGASIHLAKNHGVNEVSKQLGLPKKHLCALTSGPYVKPDGLPIPIEEWVKNNFIVVKMKQDKKEEGLLGKYRKQHILLENFMRKGIKDLDVSSTSKQVDDVSNPSEELHLLKEESLKAKLIAVEEKVAATLKEGNDELKREIATLKEGNDELKKGNDELKMENESQILQKQIAQLSGMDLVMMRKMLETCRTKCRNLLLQKNVQIPQDWNELICDAICIGALKEAGLTIGLPSTIYGKKSQQQKGSETAHSIMEDPETYATIVCKINGHQREQMMNVFEFVFGSRAEDLAFEDI